MLYSLVTLVVCLLWVPVSHARPLLLQWPLYSSPIPIQRLVLYRATNAGPMSSYIVFWDLTTTAYADSAVTNGLTYCYELRAITHTDVGSPSTQRVCGTPLP